MIAPFFQIKNRKQFFQVFSVRFLIIKQHRKNDILLNGQFGNKIKRLKNKPDISTAKDCKPVVIHGKNFFAANYDFTGRRRIKCAYHVKQRTFSRAGFSDDSHILALWNGKTDLFKACTAVSPLP